MYHGNDIQNWQISKAKKSRYGIKCLFFSETPALAKLYAIHHASLSGQKYGFIHQADITINNSLIKSIDANYNTSYNRDFRQLVYDLNKQNHKSVKINNIIDYPDADFTNTVPSTIIIVYDLSIIKIIQTSKLCTRTLKQY